MKIKLKDYTDNPALEILDIRHDYVKKYKIRPNKIKMNDTLYSIIISIMGGIIHYLFNMSIIISNDFDDDEIEIYYED